jgi:serine/threonine protein kinase/Tol biopolymer transport system component
MVDRWQKIEELINAALQKDEAERSIYLQQACAGDNVLRQEVESLLLHEKEASSFLVTPAMEVAARVLDQGSGRSMIGRQLGSYRVVSLIGSGGMGEVYQAHDTKLGRDVAIKVLPPAFTNDPERLSRFQREARLLASLNHPNVATIHGLEQSDGMNYLVMELVHGQTLAERLKTGPMPIEEALRVASQIAEALEAAHEKGVIHRDLKPANVKVTPEGRTKVLDFGLAKAFGGEGGQDFSNASTLSAMGTEEGQILGTPAYMSPEQARGKPTDTRTDIWAFGCVLYELLTGLPMFRGETISDTIAAVLGREANWQALPGETTAKTRDLLRRCVQKDINRRMRDIGDARIEIEEALSGTVEAGTVSVHKNWMRPLPLALVGFLAIVVIVLLIGSLIRTTRLPTRAITRLVVTLPPTDQLFGGNGIALSPDGSRLVYVARQGVMDTRRLYLRAIDRFEATPILGTEDANEPFFSPDGQSLGFSANGELKKVSLSGGAPLTLCKASAMRGATWGPDDMIIFAPSTGSGLYRVSAGGGSPTPLIVPDQSKGESSYRWPAILPGGEALLFTIWGGTDRRIGVLSLKTGVTRVLIDGGTYPQYLPSGHLVYAREGGLLAVPFDLRRLAVAGPPVSVLEGVQMNPVNGFVQLSTSADGSLAYLPGVAGGGERTLLWVDREGAPQALPTPSRGYTGPRLSPDGKRLAVGITGTNPGLWIYELARGTLTRLTTSILAPYQIWTSDGKRITYRSALGNPFNLDWMPADGSGVAERLITGEGLPIPGSWSPDGQVLAFSEQNPTTGWDIWLLKLEGNRKPQPFLRTPSNEDAPIFSPDGRWLAYQSDESGRDEIYIRPFPGPGGRWQISTEGGTEPLWARNGRELFYRNGDKMMAVTIETKPNFTASKPILLFKGNYVMGPFSFRPSYDVSADGQRFLMVKAAEQQQGVSEINLVLNWSEELKHLVSAETK